MHYLLGLAAQQAIGTKRDEEKAREHLRIAAEAGFGNVLMNLGLLL